MTEPARFALVELDREGLLLDLGSGMLFHLNEAAAMIWGRFLAGTPQRTIAETLSDRYRLPITTALEHVAGALVLDADGSAAPAVTQPYLYERTGDSYTLSRDGTALLVIDGGGQSVRLSQPRAIDARELPAALQSVAPKLMALRGHFVLHASAVLLDGAAVAFCGKSGSGKTTTARVLARAGAAPVCEDKLVVRLGDDRVEAYVRGEPIIMDWVRHAAAELAADRSASCEPLDQAAAGQSTTLRAIGFLDASRRHEQPLLASLLKRSQAASAMFNNAFHGSDLTEDWRRHLETAARAAGLVAAYEITAPNGLPALEAAALDMVRRGTFA